MTEQKPEKPKRGRKAGIQPSNSKAKDKYIAKWGMPSRAVGGKTPVRGSYE